MKSRAPAPSISADSAPWYEEVYNHLDLQSALAFRGVCKSARDACDTWEEKRTAQNGVPSVYKPTPWDVAWAEPTRSLRSVRQNSQGQVPATQVVHSGESPSEFLGAFGRSFAGTKSLVRVQKLGDTCHVEITWRGSNPSAHRLELPATWVSAAALSDDGTVFCIGSRYGRLRLYHLPCTEPHLLVGGVGSSVRALAVSSEHLASAHIDDTVQLYDLKARRFVAAAIDAKSGSVETLCFSPCGRQLAAAGFAFLRRYDVAAFPTSVQTVTGPLRITALSYSERGDFIVSGDWHGALRLYANDTLVQHASTSLQPPLQRLFAWFLAVASNRTYALRPVAGDYMLASVGRHAYLWHLPSRAVHHVLSAPGLVCDARCTADGFETTTSRGEVVLTAYGPPKTLDTSMSDATAALGTASSTLGGVAALLLSIVEGLRPIDAESERFEYFRQAMLSRL